MPPGRGAAGGVQQVHAGAGPEMVLHLFQQPGERGRGQPGAGAGEDDGEPEAGGVSSGEDGGDQGVARPISVVGRAAQT